MMMVLDLSRPHPYDGCRLCLDGCRWCGASLPPLDAVDAADPVVQRFGRLCRDCYGRKQRVA